MDEPTAGALYHWASILRGRGSGWTTVRLNLAGLITVLAAINVGTYEFVAGAFRLPVGGHRFQGPLEGLMIQRRQAEIQAEEQRSGVLDRIRSDSDGQ